MTEERFGSVDEILPARPSNTEARQLHITADMADADFGTETMVHLGHQAAMVPVENVEALVKALAGDGDVRAEVTAADVDYVDDRDSAKVAVITDQATVQDDKVQVRIEGREREPAIGQVSRAELHAVFERVVGHIQNYGATAD